MSETRRRPGGRSADVRDRVRRATLELLEEGGYERLQLTEVAARSGVHKTTVYRRWPSKPRLVADLMGDLADERVPTPDTGALATDLEVMLAQVRSLLEQPALRSLLRASMILADDDPEIEEVRRTFWDRQLQDASVVVTRAVDRGELPADCHPRLVLEQAFGPLYFRILVTGRTFSDADLRQLSHSVGG